MSDEDGGTFDVLLMAVGSKKIIPVVKVVRAATGMGLKDAKQLVDKAPSTLKYGVSKLEAETLKSELEGLGAVAELHASSAGVLAKTETSAALVAKFAPRFRSIKLYEDGRIEYEGQTGSIVGATARVDSSGSKRVFRDTREVFLLIEGPRVSIAAPLSRQGPQFADSGSEVRREGQSAGNEPRRSEGGPTLLRNDQRLRATGRRRPPRAPWKVARLGGAHRGGIPSSEVSALIELTIHPPARRNCSRGCAR